MKAVLAPGSEQDAFFVDSEEPTATLYFSFASQYAAELKEKKRAVTFIGENYVFGIAHTKDCDALLADL